MKEEDFGLVEGSGNVFRDLGDPHADLSIRNASLGRFTLDRLMKILAALDGRIRVTVQMEPERTGAATAPIPS